MNFARETDLLMALSPLITNELGIDLVNQAASGNSQGTAVLVASAAVNITSSTAGVNDSVQLSLTKGGISGVLRLFVIYNSSANTINVFPRSGGVIDAAGTNNAVTIGAGKMRIFFPYSAVGWTSILSA